MTVHTTWLQREADPVGPSEDEIEIEVEFTLTGGCAPTGPSMYDPGDPGSPPDMEIGKCFRVDTGEAIELTEAEAESVRADVFDRLGDFDDADGYEEL